MANINTANPGGNPTGGQQSTLSVTDMAWLKQQAVQDIVRVAQEAQAVYFQHLQQLSAAGPLTQAGYAGFQFQHQQNLYALGVTGGGAAAGAALTLLGAPAAGAIAIGGASVWGQHIQQQAAVTGMQFQQAGQIQQSVSNMGAMGGMSPGAAYQNFIQGLTPERYGVGAAFAQVADMAAQYNVSIGTVNALRDMSRTGMTPDGNPVYAERMIGAGRALSALDYRSFGYNPMEWASQSIRSTYSSGETYQGFNERVGQGAAWSPEGIQQLRNIARRHYATTGSENAEYDINYNNDAYSMQGQLSKPGGFGRLTSRFTDAERADVYKTSSVGATNTLNTDDINARLLLGGDSALQAMRQMYNNDPSALQQINTQAQGGVSTLMRSAEIIGNTQSAKAQTAYMTGDVTTALASAGTALAANRYRAGQLQAGADSNLGGIGELLGERAAVERMAQVQIQQQMGMMQYGESSPDIARNMGWSQYGQTQFAMFGDTGALQRGAGREMAGLQMGIAREDTLRKSTPLSPEQQAQSIERTIQMFERLSQVTERTIVSINNFEQGVSGTATALARGGFERTAIRGEGGQAFVGAGLDYLGKQGEQGAQMGTQLEDYINRQRGLGKSDAEIDRMPQVRNLREKISNIETGMTETAQNLIRGPASVGIRREENQLQYQIDVLQNIPGAYGSMRGAMMKSMDVLNREAQERSGIREGLVDKGIWNEGMQADYEQQQQGVGRRQASLFGQLTYGWQSMLQSEAINAPSGRMSLAMPGMSYMAAVSRGVRNPLMGSTQNDLPFFLRQGLDQGSIAGATGTPEGMAATGYTGVPQRNTFGAPGVIGGAGGGAMSAGGGASEVREFMQALSKGIVIKIEEPSPDGTIRYRTGTGYMSGGTSVQTNSGTLAEQSNILGVGKR